jgi:hypothetical protein
MARQPRRVRRTYITRSEVITAVIFALAMVWLAMMAVGLGV